MHCMAYYIFLKSLRSLEEFWKNPHVKIPPKFPSTIFQSLGKFKNPVFNPEMAAMKAPITAAGRGFWAPPPPPGPIKGPPHFGGAPHFLTLPPPLLNHARAVAIWNRSSTVGAPPPHRHPSSGEWSPGRAASCPSRLHPRGEPPWPRAAARPSSGKPLPSATGGVHGGPVDRPPRCWSMSHGPSPWHFLLENNSGIEYSNHFFI
jgi:hypothetical protein